MKKIVSLLLLLSVWVLGHEHQPHVTVPRDSGYTMMTDVASFQLAKCSHGLYSYNVDPVSDDDAYDVYKGDVVFLKKGDVLYIKGLNATAKIKWTKD